MILTRIGLDNTLSGSMKRGAFTTLLLTALFFCFVYPKTEIAVFLLTLPFFLLLYFVQFTVGREPAIESLQRWIKKNSFNFLVPPLAMLLFYFCYLLVNNQQALKGNPLWLVYYLFVPTIAYRLKNQAGREVDWFDFVIFVLLLLPNVLSGGIKQNSEMPITGFGFDSMSHVIMILSGVYAFAIVRNLKEVGFEPVFKWKHLLTALSVWAAYYLVVFLFGNSINFIVVAGYSGTFQTVAVAVVLSLITTFLHTALFEELFFRGILQNLLAQRIGRAKSWQVFWFPGFVLLMIAAFLVGYTLEGKMKWFPAFITAAMFVAAWFLEKSGKHGYGIYTSLAITGVTFGLVHYHAKSIIYIGLACLAGWAYGYTYIKTKNVFYSSLVHALVNTGVLIFGLKMIR